jgi:glutathione S-transferase
MSTIVLHQFSRSFGLPSASPFCMKLETYLRMAELPHELVFEDRLDKAPKKKIPYIEHEGQKIGDSNLVIEYLQKKYGDRTDAHLSPADRAVSLAMRRMIDENLYWALVYGRWVDEKNWPITRSVYFGELPPVVKQILPGVLRKRTIRSMTGHGMAKHTEDEIYEIGCRDIQALSDFLGDREYFFGDSLGDSSASRPTILDAAAHATIANLIKVPMDSPLRTKATELANLVSFSDRMTARFYPEKTFEQLSHSYHNL